MAGRSYILTEQLTVRGNTTTVTDVFQDASQWLDVNGAADATIVVECFDVTAPASGAVVLKIESSPFLDESTFALAAPPLTMTPSSTPVVLKTVGAVSVAGLARFVRWHISVTGSGAWSVTFRVRLLTNRSSYFRPTHIAGCALWLRSDLGIVLSGSSVSSWADQSGTGNNASAGAATPTYSTTGGVNNLPRVIGAGSPSNQYMTGPFSASISTHTLFAVLKYPALANDAAFAGTNNLGTVNSGFAQFTENPTGIIGRTASTTGALASAVTTDTSSLGSVGIYSTAAAPNGTVDIWVNGVQKASVAAPATLFACTNYYLFALSNPVQYPHNGDGYEFIVFNSVLSASDRLRVHRYLGGRYGIAVP